VGRLTAIPGLERQAIRSGGRIQGSGLRFFAGGASRESELFTGGGGGYPEDGGGDLGGQDYLG